MLQIQSDQAHWRGDLTMRTQLKRAGRGQSMIAAQPGVFFDVFKHGAHFPSHCALSPPTTTTPSLPLLPLALTSLRLVVMMIFQIPAVLVILFLAFGASAAPGVVPVQVAVQQQSKRDVWVPPILRPRKGTTWHIGQTVTVTWYV